MIDGNRQTGRTNRMINAIILAALGGKKIVVVAAKQQEVEQLQFLYKQYGGPTNADISWFGNSNWRIKTLGLRDNVVIFRDHHEVEQSEGDAHYRAMVLQSENDKLKSRLRRILGVLEEGIFSNEGY